MGKGSSTTTTQSQSAPNPVAAQNYYNLLNQAQGVASTPYQAYSGELTAPTNAQQNLGIGSINQNANFASPFIQQAAGQAQVSSAPITAGQIQNYQNPYTQQVVDATQAQINQNNQQQQSQLLGNSISQGALGGNRVGVAQANLAGQQSLANNQTIAGLYSNSYQQALQAAQAQQGVGLAGANALANYGISGQGAALAGAGAQLGAGTLQQQTQQAQDTAAYQQYAQQQAYPFQTTQWLAGLDTGVGSQLGGTSSGSTTAPPPNQTAQYAGLGLATAGLFLNRGGRVRGYADGGMPGTPWSNGVGWVPAINIHGGSGAPQAHAPNAPSQNSPAFDPSKIMGLGQSLEGKFSGPAYGGGNVFTDEWGGSSSDPLPGLTAADYGPGFRGGGGVGYADGGRLPSEGVRSESAYRNLINNKPVTVAEDFIGKFSPSVAQSNALRDAVREKAFDQMKAAGPYDRSYLDRGYMDGGSVRGYEAGGSPADYPDDPASFNSRFQDTFGGMPRGQGIALAMAGRNGTVAPRSIGGDDSVNPDNPIRLDPAATQAWRDGTPVPAPGVAPAAQSDDDEETTASAFAPTGRPSPGVGGASTGYTPPYNITPEDYAPPAMQKNTFGLGVLSPNAKTGLLAAGLGILASRSPNLGNAIGEGGISGLTAYGAANMSDLKAQEEAQKLSLEAKKAANDLSLKTAQFGETQTHNRATEANAAKAYAAKLIQKVNPATGQTEFYSFDPNTKKLTQVTPPDSSAPADKFVSTAPSVAERRNAPAASPEARDESYYNYLATTRPPGYADVVKGVADYEIDPNREASLQKGQRDQLYRDAKLYDPTYDQTHYAEKVNAIRSFSVGADRAAVNSLNVSVSHLATLAALGDALQNGDIPAINRISNTVSAQLGRPAPTNFDAAKEIVGDEVVKAVVGGVNAAGDRDAIKALIMRQQSPAQLKGIIQTFTTLLGGQLEGRRQGYQAGTGLNNFDQKYLSPATREALKASTAAAGPNQEVMKAVYPSGIPVVRPGTAESAAGAPVGATGGFTPPPNAVARQYNGKTYYYDPNTKQPYPGQ